MNGTSVLIKETWGSLFPSSATWEHREKLSSMSNGPSCYRAGGFRETEAAWSSPSNPDLCDQVRNIWNMSLRVTNMSLLEGMGKGKGDTHGRVGHLREEQDGVSPAFQFYWESQGRFQTVLPRFTAWQWDDIRLLSPHCHDHSRSFWPIPTSSGIWSIQVSQKSPPAFMFFLSVFRGLHFSCR